jgi:hypothetical protein
MRTVALGLAVLLALGAPLAAQAARGGGGGGGARAGGGGGGARAGGGGTAAARPAPASRPAGGSSGGGFNLNRDVSPSRPPANAGRPSGSGNGNTVGNRPAGGGGNTVNNRPVGGGNGNTVNNRPVGGGNGNTVNNRPVSGGGGNTINRGSNNNINVNRTVVANPVYHGPAYGWNHGAAWYPAPTYWGGGFWGAMAIGATSAVIFGSIVNATTQTTYTSYQVQPSSPGATMLSNYHLTQVQCGPPGLVVVFGPENSVICAQPNDIVAAGEYNLDTATLSLVSR